MNRDGFTMIEIVVGMMILVVGVLAMASTTGFVSMQMQVAELRTDRSVVQQQTMERLRGVDFDNLATVAKADGITVGDYTVWWRVDSLRWALKEVSVYTEGPGFHGGARQDGVVDTLRVRLARPVQ